VFAYVVGTVNMILHSVEAPSIIHTKPLSENVTDIRRKYRFEVKFWNPAFAGNEQKQVQRNFPIRSRETASLFLQHIIKPLKAGGHAIATKNTALGSTDNVSVSLRKLFLNSSIFIRSWIVSEEHSRALA
jgi:type I restriction enzyme M protein